MVSLNQIIGVIRLKKTFRKLLVERLKKRKPLSRESEIKHPRRLSRGFKKYVYKRDGFACVLCGCREKLTIHHVNGDRSRDDLDNLVLLCEKCHKKAHTVYDERIGEYVVNYRKVNPEVMVKLKNYILSKKKLQRP